MLLGWGRRCGGGDRNSRRSLSVCSSLCAHFSNALPDLLISLRPNPSTSTKAINQTAIAGEQNAYPMGGKPSFGHEFFNIGQEIILHAKWIARFCVHVNARNNVQAGI